MATMTLSVPNELKEEMETVNWVNWSSIARQAFVNALIDINALELMKKIRTISEIPEINNKQVTEKLAKEVVASIEKTSEQLKTSEKKALTKNEFNAWCNKL